jgi:type IV pilus assembly protein PilM
MFSAAPIFVIFKSMQSIQTYLSQYFKFIRSVISAHNDAGVVGLDLGSSTCRAVKIVPQQNTFELTGFICIPFKDNEAKNALLSVVKAFSQGKTVPAFVGAVCGRGTLVRYIDMPRMSLSDLRKAFSIEVERYFPFPKDTIYTDCHILDPDSQDRRMSVLIAAVKREMVDARLKLLKECGIDPAVLTINSVALANAATFLASGLNAPGTMNSASALLEINEAHAHLMIFVNGIPKFSRDIFIGIAEMIKRISNACSLSPEAARAALFSADQDERVVRIAETVVANLVAEVRLSFDYFGNEKNIPIAKLFLVGEGVMVPGLESGFTRAFDVPVAAWDPFSGISIGPGVDKGRLAAEGRSAIIALGLALNEYYSA